MRRMSSVTAPTTTIGFDSTSLSPMCRVMRDREMGGRLILDINRRLRITLLNLESVLRARNRYSYMLGLVGVLGIDDVLHQ